MPEPKFEVYQDKTKTEKQFRWRLKAENGEPVADCGEGYDSKQGCLDGIAVVRRIAPIAKIDDLT